MSVSATSKARPRIWDISQPLRIGMPVWPGDQAFEATQTVAMSEHTPFNLSRITLSTHTGAHADAPLHYVDGAAPIGAVDVEVYLGPAQLITAVPVDGLVREADVTPHLTAGVERVLLRTFALFPHDAWPTGFAAIDPPVIDALAARGVRLIGVDTPSLDPETSKTMAAHQAVARHGLAILEGLVFDGVPDGIYELLAPPLRLMTADASPVRALLREIADRRPS